MRAPWLSLILAALLPAQIPIPGPGGGGVSAVAVPYATLQQDAGGDCIFALHADTIAGMTCANAVVDGTTETAFANGVTIPANTLGNATVAAASAFLLHTTGGTTPTLTMSLRLGSISGTRIYQSPAISLQTTVTDVAINFYCTISALSAAGAATPLVATCNLNNAAFSGTIRNTLLTNSNRSIAANTTATQTLLWTAQFSTNTAGNAIGLYSIFNGIQ